MGDCSITGINQTPINCEPEYFDNDGIAAAPEDGEINTAANPTAARELPEFLRLQTRPGISDQDVWSAPHLSNTSYMSHFMNFSASTSVEIAGRTRVEASPIDVSTFQLRLVYEKAFQNTLYQNNIKAAEQGRDIVDTENQSGIIVDPSEIVLDEYNQRAPSQNVYDWMYPSLSQDQRPKLFVDQFGFLTDKDGYKIGSDGKLLAEPVQYIVENSYQRFIFNYPDDDNFSLEDINALSSDDITITTSQDTYNLDINSDEAKLDRSYIVSAEIQMQNGQPLNLSSPLMHSSFRLEQFRTNITTEWSITIDGASTPPSPDITSDASLIQLAADGRPHHVTGSHQTSFELDNGQRIVTQNKIESSVQIEGELIIVTRTTTINKSNRSANDVLSETLRFNKSSHELISADYELELPNSHIHVIKSVSAAQTTVATLTDGSIIRQTHDTNPDGSIGAVKSVSYDSMSISTDRADFHVGSGFETGYIRSDILGESMTGFAKTPYVYIGIDSRLNQSEKIGIDLSNDLYFDLAAGTDFRLGDTDTTTYTTGTGFGARIQTGVEVTDAKSDAWTFGTGARLGFMQMPQPSGSFQPASGPYRAEVEGEMAAMRFGPYASAGFLKDTVTLYGGLEWSAGQTLPSHYVEYMPSNESVDLREWLPVTSQNLFIGANVDILGLIVSINNKKVLEVRE